VPVRKIRAEIEQLRKKMEDNQRQLDGLQKKIALLEGESDTELRRRGGKAAKHVRG
jgi:predicted  nucleic acid-binding Zn-ribbon protein